MSAALDSSQVVLPGVSTPRMIARLSGMMLLSFAGALLTGYAVFLIVFLQYGDSLAGLWTPWREPALGMMFWPFVVIGAVWAWCWCARFLWNQRWVVAGMWIIAVTVPAVALGWPLVGLGAVGAGMAIIAGMCMRLRSSKRLQRA